MFSHRPAALAVATALAIGAAHAQEATPFGFPAGFSKDKMDLSASPRKDFGRYAAGTWHDALRIPPESVRISGLDLMAKRKDAALRQVVEEAARSAAAAPKGSPTQQVGDLYAAGMDEVRLKALGAAPLKPMFDRIDAVTDKSGFARALAQATLVTNDAILLSAGVMVGIHDKSKYMVVVGDGELGMSNYDDYLKPENGAHRDAYVALVARYLSLAGMPEAEAKAFAPRLLALEARVAKARLPLTEKVDPDKLFREMPYAELKAKSSGFDWDGFFAGIGLSPPSVVTAVEADAMVERARIVAETPLEDLKRWLKFEYVRKSTGGLSPEFAQAGLEFTRSLFGPGLQLPPRSKQVFDKIAGKAGHPLARLYVDRYFTAEARRDVEHMVGLVRAEFRARLVKNAWLTPATRKQALFKLDKVRITVGYPDQWIDYSPVDVRPGDWFGSLERINEYLFRRDIGRYGGPIREDGFTDPGATLPTVVNAAYDKSRNSIEIPAAFLQPPVYDPKGDPATKLCAMGAVIGHELTHGFDSGGRLYDEVGRARNWWVKQDEERFVAQARKLVRQANAYEVLPGLHANGALGVTENLADVGGIAFGYGALQRYLKAHPKENRKIDGLTQEQRCFIAWAQLWSEKSREGYLRQVTATDAHAPGNYRVWAPAQHEPGFYKAFGIRKGDPLWLDPKDRARIW
ncbi:MAG: M13 family metallopeptidase [Betaproteobacteria bacterium]|nr:M13 family metallopeptidase [Betaproteobacteria bacterium]